MLYLIWIIPRDYTYARLYLTASVGKMPRAQAYSGLIFIHYILGPIINALAIR